MEGHLKKVLSFRVILLITLNAVMGTGIFFLPALGARYAGPASLISWGVLLIFCLYMSMIFAELTSMFPTAGGVYEFCKNAFNGFWAFMIGWVTFITSNVTIAMLVVGAIQYLMPEGNILIRSAIAISFVIIFHIIAYRGMQTSATMLIAFAVITLISIGAIIIPGLPQVDAGNFSPFFAFPVSSIFLAAMLMIETFFGWETATFLAGETKDGERAVPKALIISTLLTGILSILVAFVAMGVVPWPQLGTASAPLKMIGGILLGDGFTPYITLLVYLAMIGSVAGWIVAAPRLLLSMAQDKLFITQAASIHPKYSTPYRAIWIQCVFVIFLVIAASAAYHKILFILLPLAVIQYSAVALALFVLRHKMPEKKRYFTAPFGKIGSILVTLGFLALLVFWMVEERSAFQSARLAGSIILVGVPIYFLLKIYYDPDVVIKLNDFFAYFAYITEKISLPKDVKNEILSLLGDIRGKSVLEFGCSIGTLTIDLAGKVSSAGKIFATNISAKELKISKRRIQAQGHEHVIFIHDQHQANRVHPLIPRVDCIVSFGMLTYIQDIKKVLSEMNDIIKEGGKIVMVDWVNFFHIIPDVEWLTHDDLIRSLFREAGFAVTITRKKGMFWDYLYIHGLKTKNDIVYV